MVLLKHMEKLQFLAGICESCRGCLGKSIQGQRRMQRWHYRQIFWPAEMLGFYSECGGFTLREICILPNNILGSIIQENHPGNTNEVGSGGWEISNDLYEKG